MGNQGENKIKDVIERKGYETQQQESWQALETCPLGDILSDKLYDWEGKMKQRLKKMMW